MNRNVLAYMALGLLALAAVLLVILPAKDLYVVWTPVLYAAALTFFYGLGKFQKRS